MKLLRLAVTSLLCVITLAAADKHQLHGKVVGSNFNTQQLGAVAVPMGRTASSTTMAVGNTVYSHGSYNGGPVLAAPVYGTTQYIQIETDKYRITATKQLRPFRVIKDKPARLIIGEEIDFSIHRGRLELKDADGKKQKLDIMSQALKSDNL